MANQNENLEQFLTEIEEKANPFIERLREKDMESSANKIIALIRAIESDPLNSIASLYLLLQSEAYNEIEKEGNEAAKSLSYLYEIMAGAYGMVVVLNQLK